LGWNGERNHESVGDGYNSSKAINSSRSWNCSCRQAFGLIFWL
jgi:hypothetical protein